MKRNNTAANLTDKPHSILSFNLVVGNIELQGHLPSTFTWTSPSSGHLAFSTMGHTQTLLEYLYMQERFELFIDFLLKSLFYNFVFIFIQAIGKYQTAVPTLKTVARMCEWVSWMDVWMSWLSWLAGTVVGISCARTSCSEPAFWLSNKSTLPCVVEGSLSDCFFQIFFRCLYQWFNFI